MAILNVGIVHVLVNLIVGLLLAVLPIIGAISVVGILLVLAAPKLPNKISKMVAARLLSRGMKTLGSPLLFVQDADGLYSLVPAKFDADNNGYWGGDEFYNAEGASTAPGSFYGSIIIPAYQGLGAMTDFVSGEIGRQVEVKRGESENPQKKWAPALGGILGSRFGEYFPEFASSSETAADGGLPAALGDEFEDGFKVVLEPLRVVDLRNVTHFAPYNIRPESYHRVDQNAKAGSRTGWSTTAKVTGAFVMGFMLCLIAVVVVGKGGGGIGSALPLALSMGHVAHGLVGVAP